MVKWRLANQSLKQRADCLEGDWGDLLTRVSVVMVRCPATGKGLSTGVEMDSGSFERLPLISAFIWCPLCRTEHNWSSKDAWLELPLPALPPLPWLFINNRMASGD